MKIKHYRSSYECQSRRSPVQRSCELPVGGHQKWFWRRFRDARYGVASIMRPTRVPRSSAVRSCADQSAAAAFGRCGHRASRLSRRVGAGPGSFTVAGWSMREVRCRVRPGTQPLPPDPGRCLWGASSRFRGSLACNGSTGADQPQCVCRSRWQGRAVWNEPAAMPGGLKRRGGIRGSGHPVRRPVAPATRHCPARPASAGKPGVVPADPGCAAVSRCCSAVGIRSAPDAAAVRSRSTSNPDSQTTPCAPNVRRRRSPEAPAAGSSPPRCQNS
jgi:hypothetical protein